MKELVNNLTNESEVFKSGFEEFKIEYAFYLNGKTEEEQKQIAMQMFESEARIELSLKQLEFQGIYVDKKERQNQEGRYHAAFLAKKLYF